MKFGITGGNGFIGWHLRCYLATLKIVKEVRIAGREEFYTSNKLQSFVKGLDCIVHLAGVNRADPKSLFEGNIKPAKQLVDVLRQTNSDVTVIYSSSVQALDPLSSPYAKGKADVSLIFLRWAKETNGKLINLIIPHVFGEYGKPNYNSAVATFVNQIANKKQTNIYGDGRLELVHVQHLSEQIFDLYQAGETGDIRILGKEISVSAVVRILEGLFKTYIEDDQLPDLSDLFIKNLFNTLRGALPAHNRLTKSVKHQDERGWLVETVKANSGGQCFISTTKPGVTRGNHFHRSKVERFFVLEGKAQIKIRKLFSDDVITYNIDGETPVYVDIPTLFTHCITNVGDSELITLFWADEIFNPNNSDTYFDEVVK